ncbi:MAG: hypothetical protein PWQ56_390 [Patescibacteria group bacterium]|nr:hypothetical protein [Patescibacteria group bacterium]
MTLQMNDSHIVSLKQVREFVKLDSNLKLRANSKKEMYQWINEVLNRFRYFSLRKKAKEELFKNIPQDYPKFLSTILIN